MITKISMHSMGDELFEICSLEKEAMGNPMAVAAKTKELVGRGISKLFGKRGRDFLAKRRGRKAAKPGLQKIEAQRLKNLEDKTRKDLLSRAADDAKLPNKKKVRAEKSRTKKQKTGVEGEAPKTEGMSTTKKMLIGAGGLGAAGLGGHMVGQHLQRKNQGY